MTWSIAMGGTGISKSEVCRICAHLDTEVAAWRTRPLDEQAFPYVFLDAHLLQGPGQRPGGVPGRRHRDRRHAPTGTARSSAARSGTARPRRSGPSSSRDLRDRGLGGVQLVISDAHRGLVAAIGAVLARAPRWQRCRVHFMRNALAKASKGDGEMVAAWIRTIFAQATPGAVRDQLDPVADSLPSPTPRSPRCCATPRPT